MKEYELKGKYLLYVLSRCVYPYEDIPDDPTIEYALFSKNILKGEENSGNIAKEE